MFKLSTKNLILALVSLYVVYYLYTAFNNVVYEPFCPLKETSCQGSDNEGCGSYADGVFTGEPESFSSCYLRKQIYLNSCDPDSPTSHADVNLDQRWGKLYITINANLPFALGGVMNTMWGAYHAFLVDTRTNKSINIGSLVRHGDRFYKLSTELLGEYHNYNEMWIYRQTEDYEPKLVLRGNIKKQSCSSL